MKNELLTKVLAFLIVFGAVSAANTPANRLNVRAESGFDNAIEEVEEEIEEEEPEEEIIEEIEEEPEEEIVEEIEEEPEEEIVEEIEEEPEEEIVEEIEEEPEEEIVEEIEEEPEEEIVEEIEEEPEEVIEEENIVASGKCGDNVFWKLDNEGIFTLYGTGDMYDYYAYRYDTPWKAYIYSIKKIIVEKGVTKIGHDAFANDSSLTEVILPEGFQQIANYAFYYCSRLKNITFPESLNTIGEKAFYHCEALQQVIIPGSVEVISISAFMGCKSLEKVVIEEGTTKIESSAFQDNVKLKNAVLPASLTQIADNAFYKCGNLKITCPKFSYAESYAANNGIPVENELIEIPEVVFTAPVMKVNEVQPDSSSLNISEEASYTGTLEWLLDSGIFFYDTVYTATVTLTAKEEYIFDPNVSIPEGWIKDAESSATVLILKKHFAPVQRTKITSFCAPSVPSSLEEMSTEEKQLSELPSTILANLEDGTTTELSISWKLDEGTAYSTESGAENIFTWKLSDYDELNNYDYSQVNTSGVVSIANPVIQPEPPVIPPEEPDHTCSLSVLVKITIKIILHIFGLI